YAKTHRLEDPHARAIQEAADQMVDAVQMAQDALDFAGGQDDGETDWTFGALDALEPRQFDAENFLVEEQDSALGLILGRGRHVVGDCQIRQECFDFERAEFRRVALVVKDDKSSNPLDIGLFCAKAVMLEANAIADARKETRRLRCIGGVHARQARLGSTIFELTVDFWGNYGSTK